MTTVFAASKRVGDPGLRISGRLDNHVDPVRGDERFAFNKLRTAPPFSDPPNLPLKPCRRPTKPPRPKSLKLRRKIASWNVNKLAEILMIQPG